MKLPHLRDWLKILPAAVALAAAFVWAGFFRWPPRPHSLTPKPNILILSLCSFRYDELTAYGWSGREVMPHVEKFFRESTYTFENAVNGLPWVGISSFTKAHFSSQSLFRMGYHLPGTFDDRQTIWIPSMELEAINSKSKITIGDRSLRNNLEKNHEPSNSVLKSILKDPSMRPFFTIVHFKYLHYPLIDRFNNDSQWDYFLSAAEKKIVHEYLSHPENYPEKAPFLLLLTGSPGVLAGRPAVQKIAKPSPQGGLPGKVLGLISSPELIAPWQRSAGYLRDLDIIAKIYRANLRYMDRLIAPYLELFGDENLRKNTIVILVGDHGVLHMDHNELTHANSIYEKNVRVPMAIRFPGAKSHIVVPDQLHFQTAGNMIGGLAAGWLGQDNLLEFLKQNPSDVAIMRDCSNTVRGLRYKNEYKYFVQIRDGSRHLFDLKRDPGETKNIAAENPALSEKMELLYWQNFEQLNDIDPYNCTP